MKVNCDGAFRGGPMNGGFGVVVRNADGVVLAALACPEENVESPLEVEGRALMRGMDMATKMGLEKVIFEVDCVNVAEAVWCGTHGAHGVLAWSLCGSSGMDIVSIRREANSAGDLLASESEVCSKG